MEYKTNFKQTEIGMIPEEWEVVRLGDVADLQQGKTPRREDYDNLKGFRIIKVKDFEDGNKISFAIKGERNFVKCALGERYTLKQGDSLVLSAAHSSNIVGQKIGYVEEVPCEAYFVAELIRVRPSKDLNPYLCFSILNLECSRNQIKEEVKGGHLYPRNLGKIKIPLPPLPEQNRIAFVLSTIQIAKEKTEKVIQATKELKKSMMKHLFTYGPVSLEDAEKVKLKETEIGKMPEEWEVVRLGDVTVDIKQGKILATNNLKSSGDYPVYGANGIIGYYHEFFVPENKVLITCRGSTCGNVNVTFQKSFVTNNAMILYEKSEKINWEFLSYVLIKYNVVNLKTGSGQPQIIKGTLINHKIPLPPLPTQQKIALILSAIDEKIQAEENKKKALEELFKSMLHNLMTAKIRVKDFKVAEAN